MGVCTEVLFSRTVVARLAPYKKSFECLWDKNGARRMYLPGLLYDATAEDFEAQ